MLNDFPEGGYTGHESRHGNLQALAEFFFSPHNFIIGLHRNKAEAFRFYIFYVVIFSAIELMSTMNIPSAQFIWMDGWKILHIKTDELLSTLLFTYYPTALSVIFALLVMWTKVLLKHIRYYFVVALAGIGGFYGGMPLGMIFVAFLTTQYISRYHIPDDSVYKNNTI